MPFLPLLRQRTLILSGDDDPIIPLANARLMKLLIPKSRLHVFHGGHLGLMTEAAELAPIVDAFLTALLSIGEVFMAAPAGPPLTDGDFYLIERTLDAQGRELLLPDQGVHGEVGPAGDQPLLDPGGIPLRPGGAGLRQLGIAGQACTGYGCPGGGNLLDGMIAMELARVDPSIATFFGVHSGLAMGSIFLCGSEEQKQRWLPEMARLEKIGAFGLTEPDVGSGAAGGLTTTARRDGERVGAGRAEEVDRQRHVRRLRDHLGPVAGGRPGQGVRGARRARRASPRQDDGQDRAAGGAERAHHPGRGAGARSRIGCRGPTASRTPPRCCG